jgi:hypothetical protein
MQLSSNLGTSPKASPFFPLLTLLLPIFLLHFFFDQRCQYRTELKAIAFYWSFVCLSVTILHIPMRLLHNSKFLSSLKLNSWKLFTIYSILRCIQQRRGYRLDFGKYSVRFSASILKYFIVFLSPPKQMLGQYFQSLDNDHFLWNPFKFIAHNSMLYRTKCGSQAACGTHDSLVRLAKKDYHSASFSRIN